MILETFKIREKKSFFEKAIAILVVKKQKIFLKEINLSYKLFC